jgi:hypothetical protein
MYLIGNQLTSVRSQLDAEMDAKSTLEKKITELELENATLKVISVSAQCLPHAVGRHAPRPHHRSWKPTLSLSRHCTHRARARTLRLQAADECAAGCNLVQHVATTVCTGGKRGTSGGGGRERLRSEAAAGGALLPYPYLRCRRPQTSDVFIRSCTAIQSNPIQSNPIQSNPIQSNPIQSNPIQSNPGNTLRHRSVRRVPMLRGAPRIAPIKDTAAAHAAHPRQTKAVGEKSCLPRGAYPY